jgi:uncharacterized protein YfaS (alpha-2-macroglobulin family)/TolA-binding protein
MQLFWRISILLSLSWFFLYADTLEDAKEKIRDRQYQEASVLLEKLLTQQESEELFYLLGNTYTLSGEYEKARQVLQKLKEKYPQSLSLFKSEYKIADTYIQERNFKEAYQIYFTQVQRLTSYERKAKLAEIYLKYADLFYKPSDLDKAPDYAKALRLYQEAIEVSLAPELRHQVLLKQSWCYFYLQNYHQGLQVLSSFEKELAPLSALTPEVWYLKAEHFFHLGEHSKARLLYTDFRQQYPQDEKSAVALFQTIQTYHFPEPPHQDFLERGLKASEEFLKVYPKDKRAPEVAYNRGEACFSLEQLDRAIPLFQEVVSLFSSQADASSFVASAQRRIGSVYSHQKKYTEAIQAWKLYLSNHPTDPQWNEVQQELIDLDCQRAYEFYEQKKWSEARTYFSDFLQKHPLDSRVPEVMYELGQSYFEEKAFENAILEWNKLVSKFPSTTASSHAQFSIGETYEQQLFQFEKALEAYRKVNWGDYASSARQRLEEMKNTRLTVQTERIFHENETVTLKVRTRNIKTLKVRLHRVNLLSYFKKMNTSQGLENLDLDLIEPNHTFDYTLENYEAYRLHEITLALPEAFRKPGIYAVQLSEEKLSALTFVLVSNIALIVKATRQDLLISAQNMATQQPASGVDLFISDGKTLLFEGKTNESGFYYLRDEKLNTLSDLRVLGLQQEHCASNELPLNELVQGKGISPRGFLYTDRPAYRPGETVQLRGILREVQESRYHFTPEQTYDLHLISPTGERLTEQKVKLSSFGTFHTQYSLPQGSALGKYSIKCFQKEGSTFTGNFLVQEYQVERFKLVIEPEKPYYFRGETLKGMIRASYYYGEPVVGKDITFSLTEQSPQTLSTDAKGEVAFSFSTLDYNEKQLLVLNARMGSENVYQSHQIWLTTQGFELKLSTLREVFLTQEAFDIQVEAKSIAGEGLAQSLAYEVFHLLTHDENVAEKKVQEGTLSTNEKGKGTLRLQLKEEGSYRVRVFGKDRFLNAISQDHEFYISGEKDEEMLRVLTDSDHFNVGDHTSAQLIWRGEPCLALLTYEGERFYRFSWENLKKGKNSLNLTLDALLSPNFQLAVAVMEGQKFYEVSKDFKVQRELQIKIQSNQEHFKPGDDVEVEIQTQDLQGHGISAELSLALVDEALLQQFPNTLPSITDFFYGQQRTVEVATAATNTFSYEGVSRQISEALRLEAERNTDGNVKLNRLEEKKERASSLGRLFRGGRSAPEASSTSAFGATELESAENENDEGWSAAEDGELLQQEVEELSKGHAHEDQNQTELPFLRKEPRVEKSSEESIVRFVQQMSAYWNPAVTTSDEGKAKLKIKLPSKITAWTFVLYGVDSDILVGKAQHSIRVKKDFFVELKAPKTLVEGDDPRPLVVVHNYSGKPLDVELHFKSSPAQGQTQSWTQTPVKVQHGVLYETTFPFKAETAGELQLTASGKAWSSSPPEGAPEYQDAESTTISVKPRTTEILRGTGGLVTHSLTKTLELPTGKTYSSKTFTFQYGPRLSTLLLQQVYPYIGGGTLAGTNALSSLSLLHYLESVGKTGEVEYRRHLSVLEQALAELQATQNQNGGWGFAGVKEENVQESLFSKRGVRDSDTGISALALRVLVLARRRGFSSLDHSIEKAVQYVKTAFSQANSDAEKVILLEALAHAGEADYAYVNRLYRIRFSLNSYSLALLSLIFSQLERPVQASELADLLVQKPLERDTLREDLENQHPWTRDYIELVAKSALALMYAKKPQSQVEPLIQTLLAYRGFSCWPSPKGNSAALEALTEYLKTYQHHLDRYQVQVFLNETLLVDKEVTEAFTLQEIQVPVESEKVQLRIQVQGSGEFTYQALLRGVVQGTDETDRDRYIRLEEYYTPAPLTFAGKEIPRGFSVLSGKYEEWHNEVQHLNEGQFTRVLLTPVLQKPEVSEGYLVLEHPLPGGVTVLEPTIHGDFENYELREGKLLFYLGHKSSFDSIHFDLFGFLPGTYQVLPPRIYSLFDVARVSQGKTRVLTVQKRDTPSPDTFNPTPDELYALGKAYFDQKEFLQAQKYLEPLFHSFLLQEEVYKETVKMLLYLAIDQGQSTEIIKYFELLKERYPSLVIDFERIIKIGLAYGALQEFERGLQVFRATIEANFRREGNVSNTLAGQGEFLSSIEFMKDLLKHYPDSPITETAFYSLSQVLYEKSEKISNTRELVEKKVSRETLIQSAMLLLKDFLSFYPQNPLADEASFSLANTYLDLLQYQEVVALCDRLMKRFSQSSYVDDFLYIQGFSQFYLRHYEQAQQILERLFNEEFPLNAKERGRSENRYLARYIIGQISHARGKAKEAIEHYQQIQDRFPDAKEAIEFFQRKELNVEEVLSFPLGQPVRLKISHRNLRQIDVKIYKVDLMKLYLLHKNLDQISKIHLAGVEPFFSQTLNSEGEYQEKDSFVSPPLSEAGAYLVMLKGEELDASSMLLLSNLRVEVQEDLQSGLVRVNVLQNNHFQDQVHIKVIGSHNQDFLSGESDLRGLFLANNIQGTATVIAKKENHYGFYRGVQALQKRSSKAKKLPESQKLDEYIQRDNKMNRSRSSEQMRQLFKSQQKGVQIEYTK